MEIGVKGDPQHQCLGLHTERGYMFSCPHTHENHTHTLGKMEGERKKEGFSQDGDALGKA